MKQEQTTLAVQHFLDELAGVKGETPAEPFIRDLIGRSVDRLHVLCRSLLLRKYPRLTQPPLNLQSEEMLSAVVDRLLKALRDVRPGTVRQFFALANQHMRWELNDLARRLDNQTLEFELSEGGVVSPDSSESQLSPNTIRILEAIDELPEAERDVFDLVRIQGFAQVEAAEVLGISPKTVQRRLNRGLLLLSHALRDLEPSFGPTNEPT